MKASTLLLAIVTLSAVGAGSYWLGTRSSAPAPGGASATAAAPAASEAPKPRKLLYYRNPMGLADTSPTPKKDPMGMDYIAVYADEQDEPGTVKVSLDKVQRSGVRTEKVEARQEMLKSQVEAQMRLADIERILGEDL